jgi:hypothetical protein
MMKLEFGTHPLRKSKALMIMENGVHYTVAYFRNDEEFERWRRFLIENNGRTLEYTDETEGAE